MTIHRPAPFSLTPEFRLVAACSWAPRNTAHQTAQIEALSIDSLDWDEVAALVIRHGLAGNFFQAMDRNCRVTVPDTIKERLKGLRQQQAARALGQVAELSRVGRVFADAGVDLIPLKGVALSQELYGAPTIRNAGDIDILVRVEDVATAGEMLAKLGYRHALGFHGLGARQQHYIVKNLHHHEYINDEKGVIVELHWRGFLWTEEQVVPLWTASYPAVLFGETVRHLSNEDNILFLADHGARHGWECLKWLSDVAMLLENLSADEWGALYARAACFDLQRVLLQTAVLLEWFFEIAPPARFKKMLAADSLVARLAGYGATQLLASREELAMQAKRFAGPRQTLRIKRLKPATALTDLVRNVMIKPEDFLAFPLPDGLYWLYLPLRPWFWFRRHYMASR
jgi:hypothetical protein